LLGGRHRVAQIVPEYLAVGLLRGPFPREGAALEKQYIHRALAFADDCLLFQRGTLAWKGSAKEAHGEVLRHYLGDAMTAA
jgi:hypothetical protein